MIARLVRYYHIDPERVWLMPVELLTALIREMPRLKAEENLLGATISAMPWMPEHQRRSLLSRWSRLARRPEPDAEDGPEIIEADPQRAREWFTSIGARVASKSNGEEHE